MRSVRVEGGCTPSTRTPCSDRKSTRLNSSHANISYAVFCLKKKKKAVRDQPGRFVQRRTRPTCLQAITQVLLTRTTVSVHAWCHYADTHKAHTTIPSQSIVP